MPATTAATPSVIQLTPSQLTELLSKSIPAGHPVLVTGMPGCGKSDIIDAARKSISADLILSHPSVEDPTVPAGLPMASPGDTVARFLPFGHLARAMDSKTRTVWFLDDLGQATPAVQAAYMQLLLARQVNGHVLPDTVTFVAATNRRVDRANVSGILEPVKSRFVTIVELTPTIDDWSKWANTSGFVSPMLIAFLRYRPELLAAFSPTADLTNSPTPRTWANLAKVENLGLSSTVEAIAFAGSVGQSAALEYVSFRRMYQSLTLVDSVLSNPDKVTLPTQSNQLYAVCAGLAHRANDVNFSRIATFANRLATEGSRGEFAAMLVTDCARRDVKIPYTDAYVRLQCGVVGQLLNGAS